MDAKQEVKSYIETKEIPGALLLTGEWGCGKTYLIKSIADEYKENYKRANSKREPKG